MKNFVIILTIILMISSIAFAEEQSNQEIVLEANKASIAVQKQPMNNNSNQKAEVKNNWFCVVVQCNGKVPYDKTDN